MPDELPQHAMGVVDARRLRGSDRRCGIRARVAFREEGAFRGAWLPARTMTHSTRKVYYPSDQSRRETEILRFEDRETGD